MGSREAVVAFYAELERLERALAEARLAYSRNLDTSKARELERAVIAAYEARARHAAKGV